MYYFFGAGNNCFGAVNFLGKDRVLAIIDNNIERAGTSYDGIPIITFEEFLHVWKGEKILVTTYLRSGEVVNQLKKSGISNYYVCPHMQSGFLSCDEFIKMCGLLEYASIDIYDENPFAELFVEKIKLQRKDECNICIVNDEIIDNEKRDKAEVLLIVKEGCRNEEKLYRYKNTVDLFDVVEKNRKLLYKYLEKYKNIYNGKRCFVLGNGPSMNVSDLEKIYDANEISFASNRIYKIFASTNWRPSYYLVGDSMLYMEDKELIPSNIICFIRDFYNKARKEDNINWYCAHSEKYYSGYPQFSDDLVYGVYGGRTITYDMLQIAVYMGFKEIYLLGVDFSWEKKTHFYKDDTKDEFKIGWGLMYKEETEHAYIAAREYADQHGIKIYNATRGGYLEVFERVDFDELFN